MDGQAAWSRVAWITTRMVEVDPPDVDTNPHTELNGSTQHNFIDVTNAVKARQTSNMVDS